MLELKNICKSYKTGDYYQKALHNINLKFRENEFVAILGPSGSGKTTLLNIIGGLDRYDTGDLIINSYQETLEVTDEELKIMKYFIMFPQSFWQIGLQYYWEQQPWNEEVFINKIIRYLEDVEYREVFLDEYFK